MTIPDNGPSHKGTKSGFGYLWWGVAKSRFHLHEGIVVASGLGTQKLYIIPKLQTVVVFLKDTDDFDPTHPERTVIGTKRHDQFLSQILIAGGTDGK
jgi:CubicO group peptidase (beta-lactamase class C family)